MLLRCYRDGTDPKHADGWFPTGDVGQLADDGRLVVDGRRGDLIITGGENVWPEPVEAVLRDRRGVADVAVAGRRRSRVGPAGRRLRRPRRRAAPPTLDALRSAVKDSARRPRGAARARARRRSPAHGARQGAARRAAPASVASRPWHHASKEKSQSSPGARSGHRARHRAALRGRGRRGRPGRHQRSKHSNRRSASSATRRPRLRTDVMAEDDVVALCEHAPRAHGRLDIGVNAAGLGAYAPCVDQDTVTWDIVMAVNLRGVMLSMKHEARADDRGRRRRLDHQHRFAQRVQPPEGMGLYCATKRPSTCTRGARLWSSALTASG